MATTTRGFPYPLPTDPIAAGADAIKALAEAVDAAVVPVTAVLTDANFATTSTTPAAVTGLNIVVTPRSAAAKFLLTASLQVGALTATDDAYFHFMRNGTPIGVSTGGTARNQTKYHYFQGAGANAAGLQVLHLPMQYVDAPATTAAVTYTVALSVRVGGLFLNRRGADAFAGGISTLTVQQIIG